MLLKILLIYLNMPENLTVKKEDIMANQLTEEVTTNIVMRC